MMITIRQNDSSYEVTIMKNEQIIRKTEIRIGELYVIDSPNPKATRNRGRKCEVLGFNEEEAAYLKQPTQAIIRYLDNNRRGKAQFEVLKSL